MGGGRGQLPHMVICITGSMAFEVKACHVSSMVLWFIFMLCKLSCLELFRYRYMRAHLTKRWLSQVLFIVESEILTELVISLAP